MKKQSTGSSSILTDRKSVNSVSTSDSDESSPKSSLKNITMDELKKHCTSQDAWICIEGKAYDITHFIHKHPGGTIILIDMLGKDCTDPFLNYHPEYVNKIIKSFYIGDITDYKVSDFVKEHRKLRINFENQGLFHTRPLYYVGLFIWYIALFSLAIYLTAYCQSVILHLTGACIIALFWQQSAFLGHDLGHSSMSHKRLVDTIVGKCINTFFGVGMAWWKRSHNVHHVVCNSVENDPNIQHIPLFIYNDALFGKWFSNYHQRWFSTTKIAKFLVSYQHYLFYPVMAVARYNLYVQSWRILFQKERIEYIFLEFFTLGTFQVLFHSILYYSLGSWQEILAYNLISHGLVGILHVQISISHIAEDIYHGMGYNNESDEWFKLQLKTTMNVDCPVWMDWFHGGLQFQIEHHLFPRLPRHNLRKVRTVIKAFAKKHGINYEERSFWEANVKLVKMLKKQAENTEKLTNMPGGFYELKIWEGFNALG